jgi:hypothetical protein
MADVDLQRPDLRERIDFVLASLEGFWGELPDSAGEFASLPSVEKADFAMDTVPPMANFMDRAEAYAERGALNAEEMKRLESVRALAKKRQPLLDRILAG